MMMEILGIYRRWEPYPSPINPKVEHFPALPYAEIGAFIAELRNYAGTEARALELAILTAARSREVRLATWEEIDFSARQWTVPGGRMKAV